MVLAGTLRGGIGNAFSSNSATTLATGATLDLGGFNQTIGSLAGAGTVSNSGGTAAVLTAGGDNSSTVFSGLIQDDGPTGLTKTGTGTLTLSGTSTYSGVTTVAGGTLGVDGSIVNSAVTVQNGGTLAGHGMIGGLVAQNGATIAPVLLSPSRRSTSSAIGIRGGFDLSG